MKSSETRFNRIAIVGLGYIGLPTAAVLASRKIEIIGIEIDPEVVDIINSGKIHIVEPDLDMVVHAAVTEGYLKATTEPEPADAFLIAVPTPLGEKKQPNLEYVEAAARSIAPVLKSGNLIVLESTSPVGTTEMVSACLADERPDLTFPHTNGHESDIRVAHCPERVLPGRVLKELIQNDRVIGGITPRCSEVAAALYRTFTDSKMLITDARTAEMCKLVENSFRDVNIAFANELSMICDESGVDVWELISLANHHPRVNVLQPGTGVGGHCLAVDPWFLVNQAPKLSRIIRTARETNDYKPIFVANKIADTLQANQQESVTCLGLSFKPDVDDLRESPAISVVIQLVKKGLSVTVVEPYITELPEELFELGVHLAPWQGKRFSDSELVVILVAHGAFKSALADLPKTCIDFCGALQ